MLLCGKSFLASFLVLSLAVNALAIDLCALLGVCNNNNNNNNNGRNNGRNFPNNNNRGNNNNNRFSPEWLAYDDEKEFLFGVGERAMDWWQADRYCERQGGYLAEPQSAGEHAFLRDLAAKYGYDNWWLGLRLAEDCNCDSLLGGRNAGAGGASYRASISLVELLNSQNKYAGTECRNGFRKQCRRNGGVWRWVSDGSLPQYQAWNRGTGEPQGPPEYCAIMWNKENFNWADWRCDTRNDAGSAFLPICEKFIDYVDKQQPLKGQKDVCADYDVFYKGGDRLDSYNNVGSADLCRARCVQYGSQCVAWTWRGADSRRQRCHIFGSYDYDYSYNSGAVSGTLRGGCRSLALSQLSDCYCSDPDALGEYDYDYSFVDDYDFIEARSVGGSPVGGLCSRGEVLRCLSSGGRANTGINARSSFGSGGGGGGGGRRSQSGIQPRDRVTFG